MTPFLIAVLAFSMSIDAFAAAIARGASLPTPCRFCDALRTGLVFGLTETSAALIGWLIGSAASGYVQSIDHWIAFTLLAVVGGKMFLEGVRRPDPSDDDAAEDGPSCSRRKTFAMLLLTAVGTSIDAMAVGISLALLEVNILLIAAAIGSATLIMSTSGIMAGRFIGKLFGRYAEMGGGLVLVTLGTWILIEHLMH